MGGGELQHFHYPAGETADTTAAQREAKLKGSRSIAIST